MPPLKAGCFQFIFAGHTASVAAGNGTGSVRAASTYFINGGLSLVGIGKTHNYHSMMQKRDLCGKNSRLLAAVLSSTGAHYASDLADQRSAGPLGSGGIEKHPHLAYHISKPGWNTENHRVGPLQIFRAGYRHIGPLLLCLQGTYLAQHLVR